jgi:hypothetical protein
MKRIVFAVLLSLTSTLIQVPVNAATVGCPDTWNFKPTTGEIPILETSSLSEDFLSKNRTSIESFNEAAVIGQKLLMLPSIFDYLPTPYYQKIQEGGRNIAVSGQIKTSLDGKNWFGLRNYNGDLLTSGYSRTFLNPPPAAMMMDRIYPIALASRSGLIPGNQVSLEVKVNVNGCKEAIFYERNAVVPSYKVETRKFDNLIDLYYRINPSEGQINFLDQQIYNKTINTFVDHLREISKKNSTWTISNTRRGVLDIFWTLTGEGTYPSPSQPFPPFIDLYVSPTNGDGCFTLTTPFISVFTYKTFKYPCSISIDLFSNKGLIGAFEVARFEIASPKAKTATITCIKGKVVKKVTAVAPKCPAGYKKR